MSDSYLVGVAGPSSCGKTTLCRTFVERVPNTAYLCIDDFYRDAGQVPRFNDGTQTYDNWDEPESLHLDDFLRTLKILKRGEGVEVPVYDVFKERRVGSRYIEPAPHVVVDGFLLYATTELQQQFDFRVFIDVSEENLRKRRNERNIDYIPTYLDDVVLPAFKRIGPFMRSSAHHIIDGNQTPENVLEDFESLLKTKRIR